MGPPAGPRIRLERSEKKTRPARVARNHPSWSPNRSGRIAARLLLAKRLVKEAVHYSLAARAAGKGACGGAAAACERPAGLSHMAA